MPSDYATVIDTTPGKAGEALRAYGETASRASHP